MNRSEFYEKYKDVDFYLSSYYKYTFNFTSVYKEHSVNILVGGNSEDMYRESFVIGEKETIMELQPYGGNSSNGDSFYDY